MELTENEIFQNYAEHGKHCLINTLPTHQYEFICIACGYNVCEKKMNLQKIKEKFQILILD